MASVYDKYYERQPTVVKVIVAAGLGLVGYSIYQSVKRAKEEKEALKAAEAASLELQALANQGIIPSYNDSQFQVYVNELVQAMTGCGTNEDSVYHVISAMQNEADVRKLIVAFGVRYYQPCSFESPISFAIWQLNDQAYGGDLATWLAYDLNAGEIDYINSILSGKGISYRF
jgi:hypothetical protein